jgi:hypothetical protein
MAIEILSYNTSILNPVLKLLIVAAFVVAALLFYRSRQNYGGILRQVSVLLFSGALAGIIASAFRYQGDIYQQFKWGESILDLVLVLIMLSIALVIRAKMQAVLRVFGSGTGDVRP